MTVYNGDSRHKPKRSRRRLGSNDYKRFERREKGIGNQQRRKRHTQTLLIAG